MPWGKLPAAPISVNPRTRRSCLRDAPAETQPRILQGEDPPAAALASGDDGLADIRRLARDCRALLKPGSRLILEHGIDQQAAVAQILTEQGWTSVQCHADLTGRPRATVARVPL